MSHLLFGGLLSTPAPTAPIVGIAFIVLFAIVGIMVGPDYDGMNAPALGNTKEKNQNWFFFSKNIKLPNNTLVTLFDYKKIIW